MSAPKLTGNRCQCPTCGQYFSRVRMFDRHRVGPYGKKGEPCGRRCLTVAEMAGRGWLVNVDGLWVMDALGDAGKGRLRASGKQAVPQGGIDSPLSMDGHVPAMNELGGGARYGEAG